MPTSKRRPSSIRCERTELADRSDGRDRDRGATRGYGFDQDAVTTEVYVQAREVLVLFVGLLNAAQTKRALLLREIRHQRLGGRIDVRPR